MPSQLQQSTRIYFVDFIYAIVVGSTFPLLAPFDASFRLAGFLFLIVVILEDFYLFHTQITNELPDAPAAFSPLLLELSILVAWYFAVISFPQSPRPCLVAFGSFFFLKWLAAIAHRRSIGPLHGWRFHRAHSFLVPGLAAALLAWYFGAVPLNNSTIWITILAAWLLYMVIWWSITRYHEDPD